MAQPSPGDVHVNRPLSNISIAFQQGPAKYIARRVFPNVPVSMKSDLYYTYDRGRWLRSEVKQRPDASESAGSGWAVSTDSYGTKVYSVHKDIGGQALANQDAPINLERESVQWVTGQLLLEQDIQWQQKYFATGVWTTELAGVASDTPGAGEFERWDRDGSTPIQDITGQALVMEGLTGFAPNKLVISPHVFNDLQNHADILDRIKYTQRGVVTLDLLAMLFNVEEVLVGRAVLNSAQEGEANSIDFLFGKHALLAYSAPAPTLVTPSAGYTFSWTGYLGASQTGTRIKRIPIDLRDAIRIEGDMAYDMKVVSADLGVFFRNAVS